MTDPSLELRAELDEQRSTSAKRKRAAQIHQKLFAEGLAFLTGQPKKRARASRASSTLAARPQTSLRGSRT